VTNDEEAFFANPQTWDILDDKQKSNVLELLPLQAMEQDVDGKFRLSHAFLTNNPDWVSDTSGLQEDIAEGKYNPARMSQAMAAHDTRVQGGFDNFKDEEFEVFWGMKQKLAVGVVAGTSSDVKLTELIREGLILVGDTWSFVRTLHTGGAKILVEKESIVCHLGLTLALLSNNPSGGLDYSSERRYGASSDSRVHKGHQQVFSPRRRQCTRRRY
jgi:hypothetical protein